MLEPTLPPLSHNDAGAFDPPRVTTWPGSEPGSLAGDFSVTASGSATYTIAIPVLPGRAGMQPAVSLVYGSGADEGVPGVGWQLVASSEIRRCRLTMAQDGEARPIRFDKFDGLCLDGVRLSARHSSTCPRGGRQYHTYIESFARICAYGNDENSPEYFEVWHSNGRVSEYGSSNGAALFQTQDHQVLAWSLSKVRDRSGNYIRYNYGQPDVDWPMPRTTPGAAQYNAAHILLSIEYTGNISSGLEPKRSVRFTYKRDPSQPTGFFAGAQYSRNVLLGRMETYGPDGIDSTFVLNHAISRATNGSLLQSIQHCDGHGRCKRPTGFEYTDGRIPSRSSPLTVASLDDRYRIVADLDGDGQDEIWLPSSDTGQTVIVDHEQTADQIMPVMRARSNSEATEAAPTSADLAAEISAITGNAPKTSPYRPSSPGPGRFISYSAALVYEGIPLRPLVAPIPIDIDNDGLYEAFLPAVAQAVAGGVEKLPYSAVVKFVKNADGMLGLQTRLLRIPSSAYDLARVNERHDPFVAFVGDFNGDGLHDLAYCEPESQIGSYPDAWYVRFNLGLASVDSLGEPSQMVRGDCARQSAFAIDSDGDGASELAIETYYGLAAGLVIHDYELGNFFESETSLPKSPCDNRDDCSGFGRRIVMDSNGDGLKDITLYRDGKLETWLNTGKDFFLDASLPLGSLDPAAIDSARVLDWDRDGRDDLLIPYTILYDPQATLTHEDEQYEGKWVLRLSKADGVWWQATDLSVHRAAGRTYTPAAGDFDGDGSSDFAVPDAKYNGNGVRPWLVRSGVVTISDLLATIRTGMNAPGTTDENTCRPDVEIYYRRSTDWRVYTPELGAGCLDVDVRCLTNPMTLVANTVSSLSGNCTDDALVRSYHYQGGRSHVGGRGWLGFAKRTVTSAQVDGADTSSTRVLSTAATRYDNTTRMSFKSGSVVFPFAGLAQREITDSGAFGIWNNEPARRTAEATYYRATQGLAPGTYHVGVVGRETTEYERPVVERRASGDFVALSTKVETFDSFDEYGNPKRITTNWHVGAYAPEDDAAMDSTARNRLVQLRAVDAVGPSEVRSRTYLNDESQWFIGLLGHEEVVSTSAYCNAAAVGVRLTFLAVPDACPHGGQARVAESFEYDAAGLPFRHVVEKSGGGSLVTTTWSNRDEFGNALMMTVEGDNGSGSHEVRFVRRSFDTAEHMFVTESHGAEPASIRKISYAANSGLVASSTDANGLTSEWKYDGFGRLVSEKHPDGVVTTASYEIAERPDFKRHHMVVTQTLPSGSLVQTYYDRKGRSTRTQWEGSAGRTAYQETKINPWNRSLTVSAPAYEGQQERRESIRETDIYGRLVTEKIKRFDATGRGLDVASDEDVIRFKQIGSERYRYQGSRIDGIEVRNGRGEVILTVDAAGKSTAFIPGAFGRTWFVIDSAQRVTFVVHDDHGRKTRVVDPSAGEETYTYNAFGDVVSHISPTRVVDEYYYDRLGRLTSHRNSRDGESRFIWDSANGAGIGALAEAISSDGHAEQRAYDALGRLQSITHRASATPFARDEFVSTFSYDSLSRLDTLTYPATRREAAFSVRYRYDATGEAVAVSSVDDGKTLAEITDRDAEGHVLGLLFGNGVREQRRYSPSMGRLQSISTAGHGGGASGHGAVEQDYQWDLRGNLTHRHQSVESSDIGLTNRDDWFSYDGLDRLVRTDSSEVVPAGARERAGDWAGTSVDSSPLNSEMEITYDESGNITQKSDVGVYSYDRWSLRLQSVDGSSLSYDEAGRITSGPGLSIEYTGAGSPRRVSVYDSAGGTDAATSMSYGYDAHGSRCLKTSKDESRLYIDGLSEHVRPSGTMGALNQGLSENHYLLRLGGIVIGKHVRRDSGPLVSNDNRLQKRTLFTHRDHLGSPLAVTDDLGIVIATTRYGVFGEIESQWGEKLTGSAMGYTGHEDEPEIGLVNMGGRIYHPRIGRFLQPDPFVQEPQFSQSLNRYAYVWGNPMSLVDPSGFEAIESSDAGSLTEEQRAEGVSDCSSDPYCTLVVGRMNDGVADGWGVSELNYRPWTPPLAEPQAQSGGHAGRDAILPAMGFFHSSTNERRFFAVTGLGVQGPTISQQGWRERVTGVRQHFLRDVVGQLPLIGPMFAGILGPIEGIATGYNPYLDDPWQSRAEHAKALAVSGFFAFITHTTLSAAVGGGVAAAEAGTPSLYNLGRRLAFDEASGAFTATGELSEAALQGSRQIFVPGTLGNPTIPQGFGKFSTGTFQSPAGPFQAHFYMNPTTREVFYGLDYKAVFNDGVQFFTPANGVSIVAPRIP